MNPLKFLADKLGGNLFKGVESIIDQFVDDPQEVAEAKSKLLKERRKIQNALLEYEQTRLEEAGKTIRAEVHSDHWLAANIRPLTLLTFLLVSIYAGIFAPIFGLPAPMLGAIPDRAWSVIMMGLGGYIGSRGVEKITPVIADAYRDAKNGSTDTDEVTRKVLEQIGDARAGDDN